MEEYSIQIRFKQALDKADSLDKIAEKLSGDVVDDIDDLSRKISTNWTGENSKKYLNKVVSTEEDIKNLATNVKRVASTIRAIAQEIYEAEMKALELARTREAYLLAQQSQTTGNM